MSTASAPGHTGYPLRVTVAEEVRALLGRRRMSAVALGLAIGKSQSYVSRRLTGDTAFDTDDLDAIAAALGVEVSTLMGASPPGSRPTPGGGVDNPRYGRILAFRRWPRNATLVPLLTPDLAAA